MSDVEFVSLICRETGAGLLLDVENLYLNANNHGFNSYEFVDALPRGIVKEIHMAGGVTVIDTSLKRPFLADSHSHPMPDSLNYHCWLLLVARVYWSWLLWQSAAQAYWFLRLSRLPLACPH